MLNSNHEPGRKRSNQNNRRYLHGFLAADGLLYGKGDIVKDRQDGNNGLIRLGIVLAISFIMSLLVALFVHFTL